MIPGALEAICAAIIAHFIWARSRIDPAPRRFVATYLALATAAWIGETTCIRLYGFYAYADVWSVWLDVTPVMVPLIWPAVILSCRDLAARLVGSDHRPLVAPVAAAFVLADAAFIEPIAVEAGLWHWTEPGLFGVPPIGVLGWSFFALAALEMLRRRPGLAERPVGWLALLVGAPLVCHGMLLATWWGALRWVSGPIAPWAGVAVAAAIGAALVWLSVRHRAAHRVPRGELMLRIPAALFFVGLLALEGRDAPALLVWSAAFVLPWLSLLRLESAAAPASARVGE